MTGFWRLPPMTQLLAVFATWAVLAAVVAATGVGGRYALHADDPGLVPELPAYPAPGEGLAGQEGPFDEASNRPLFSADRRPAPVQLGEEAPVEASLDVVLTSVVLTSQVRAALVMDNRSSRTERVFVGEEVPGSPGWRLLELSARSAVFDGPDGRVDLELRVYDGMGGEPPTAVSREATAQRRASARAGEGQEGADPRPGSRRAELLQRAAEADAARAAESADEPLFQDSSDGAPDRDRAPDADNDTEARPGQDQQGPLTPEQQAEEIRRRIEERRRQLRGEVER